MVANQSLMSAQQLFVSSGDLLADRRYRWALDYLQRGDAPAALDILAQVVESTPTFATAWFALALVRERLGDRDGAIAAFRAACDADREDYHGARLHLARLGDGEATPAMTAVYVRRLFDQHAPEFDEALVGRLDYRGPALLLDAVRAVVGTTRRFGSVLDLGCGTGLAGAAFRPFCDWLVGVDISPGMIEQARRKGLYDRLEVSDLTEFLIAETGASFHLVLAADVLVYCSEIVSIAARVARVLAPGGMFAFTVETHDDPGVRLQDTLRYAHGPAHVRSAVAAAGLRLLRLAEVSTRTREGCAGAGALGGGRASGHVSGRRQARTVTALERLDTAPLLPELFAGWFAQRGWTPRAHQLELLARARAGRSVLLIAPTGGGKTLAGFLPTLVELTDRGVAPRRLASTGSTLRRPGGLHTLYISPLKALAVDIARNLETPVAEMGLPIRIETRTGDTPASKRQRQRRDPPDILLTTPEQLALLLGQRRRALPVRRLQRVVLDELHALVTSKRGDLLSLGLARLYRLAPGLAATGLSATVAEPDDLCRYLVPQADRRAASCRPDRRRWRRRAARHHARRQATNCPGPAIRRGTPSREIYELIKQHR